MNENPKMHRRLEDRLAAAKAGKSLRIVVQGKCKVCRRRSADVPATKTQVMAWFGSGSTEGFLKYEIRMLKTGVHRDCQKVEDARKAGKKVAAPKMREVADCGPKTLAHMEKVMQKRKKKAAAA